MKNLELSSKKIVAIILVSTLLGLVYNLFSGSRIDFLRSKENLQYFTEEPSLKDSALKNEHSPLLLKWEKVEKMYKSGEANFIDARDRWDYNEGHIPGAINIEEYNFEEFLPEIDKLKKNNNYIVYCDGDDCDISKRLANKLVEFGFTKVYVYEGGWKNWKSKGFAIEKSD